MLINDGLNQLLLLQSGKNQANLVVRNGGFNVFCEWQKWFINQRSFHLFTSISLLSSLFFLFHLFFFRHHSTISIIALYNSLNCCCIDLSRYRDSVKNGNQIDDDKTNGTKYSNSWRRGLQLVTQNHCSCFALSTLFGGTDTANANK